MMFPPCGDSYVRPAFTARAVARCSPERHAQVAFRCSFLLRCQDFANQHELPEVICVVIDNEQYLAKQRLSISMCYGSKEIVRLVSHEITQPIEIGKDLFDARLPLVGTAIDLSPIAVGPWRRFVAGIAAKFKDVPLSDPNMLEQIPRRVRRLLWPLCKSPGHAAARGF